MKNNYFRIFNWSFKFALSEWSFKLYLLNSNYYENFKNGRIINKDSCEKL